MKTGSVSFGQPCILRLQKPSQRIFSQFIHTISLHLISLQMCNWLSFHRQLWSLLRGVYSDTTQLNWPSWTAYSQVSRVLFMTSRPTNWVNWVTTFIDRWQRFTLWTCRQLDVELSSIELSYVAINTPWHDRPNRRLRILV